jgi:hypothetical protein
MVTIFTGPFLLDYETRYWYEISANPNRGCSHFPHDVWSAYQYLSHYQSEDSRAH